MVNGNTGWMIYSKEEIHADCFFVDLYYFSHQIEKRSAITPCKNGKLPTFGMLTALNMTTDNLVGWAIPFDLIEQYAAYSNSDENIVLAELTICNCTQNRVGRDCDYDFISQVTNPGQLLSIQINGGKIHNSNKILMKHVDGITCTDTHPFLEWRNICDGIIQCQNGADELHCHL